MSGEREDGGPAFPNYKPYAPSVDGMSLRDYFAAQALTLFAGRSWGEVPDLMKTWATSAYALADAMLAARAKP